LICQNTLASSFALQQGNDSALPLATAMDDGEIMAVRHNYYPLFGLQFHPESIATEEGGKLIRAFLIEVKEEERV
ncbi:glutamine amidotransferase-related protein, partial [Bacillus sp. B-TM1]